MNRRRELRTGVRMLIMALVFLAMSCEEDGDDGDGCLGSTDGLIAGCSDGCGTGMKPVGGDGCMGDCLLGSADGSGCMGDCLDLDDCLGGDGCGDCGDCGSDAPYEYTGDYQEDAVQIQVTNSLFNFVNQNLYTLLEVALGDDMPIVDDKIKVCIPHRTDIEVTELCRHADSSGPCAGTGCALDVEIGNLSIVPQAPNGLKVAVTGVKANGDISANYSRCDTIKVSTKSSGISLEIGMKFRKNNEYPTGSDENIEIYLGGSDDLSIGGIGNLELATRCRNCKWYDEAACVTGGWSLGVGASLAIGIVGGMIEDQIGAISCRGCDSNADCGTGATCGGGGVCNYPGKPFGQLCQGLQLGMDAKVDATGLLQSIDPGASAALGLGAWLGSVNAKPDKGIGFGARLGSASSPSSLCVPARPSPLTASESCRNGKRCPLLSVLEEGEVESGDNLSDPFHIGIAIAQGGLNQLLWSVYDSGALCLSIGGDSDAIDGLDMLNTDLIGVLVNSLSSLTAGTAQPIMIQLRPEREPRIQLKKHRNQGAELDLEIPRIGLDFYTVVDQRYARIFTLTADIKLPLGVKATKEGGTTQLEIAIGDLADLIDPETTSVTNVDMISRDEVESLVAGLPGLIDGLAGELLGDDLIPPIEIPEMMGFSLDLVGPGLTVLDEGDRPAVLGIFATLGFANEGGGGLHAGLEPEIADLRVDIQDPRSLRADMAARRQAGGFFTYQELMPSVEVDMAVTGAADAVEYAYSINRGPWTFWEPGPTLKIDRPLLANENKYDVRITARRAGDANSGSKSHAKFSFVNDYTAPTAQLVADGSRVIVDAEDNVYDTNELTMRTRFNSGTWSESTPIAPIDIQGQLAERERVVVDVMVEDPSGNSRMVRRAFGEKKAPVAAVNSGASSAEGCSSSESKGGLLAAFALMGLLFIRGRRPNGAIAASPARIALAVLAILLLGVGSAGCKNKDVGGVDADECDPACDSNSECVAGECVPIECSGPGDCPGGGECVDGECIYQAPCGHNDDCDYGHICKNDVCVASECSVSDDCSSLSCPEGELPFCDYDDWSSVEAGECVCSESVPMRNYGTWLRTMPLEDGRLIALAYHETYGDLIFGTLQSDDSFEWDFIDGVPSGPVVGPSSGRRAGIRAAGDDAGRYVSAVVEKTDAGEVIHAAYQYQSTEEGTFSLRYARGIEGAAGWSWSTIDIDDLDVAGMFPTIALVPSAPSISQDQGDVEGKGGGIAIVYMSSDVAFAPSEDAPLQYFAQVSSAYSETREPESAEDFEIAEGLVQAENTDDCGGLCASRAVCAKALNACVETTSGCNDCEENETCVDVEGQAECHATSDGSAGMSVVPFGIGLFSSSVVDADGVMHVSFYDQAHGNLRYMSFKAVNGALAVQTAPMVVDGEDDAESVGDVGRWTNIHAMDDGKIVIFYEDAGRAELRAAVVEGNNVAITVLDDGVYSNHNADKVSTNRVGANAFARPLEDGGFEVFYQDATDMVARRVVWDDMSAAPTAHPYGVFGTEDGYQRDPSEDAQDVDSSERVVATPEGGYGFFIQVQDVPGKTVFASKRFSYSASVSRVETDVQAGSIAREGGDDGEGGVGDGPGPDPDNPLPGDGEIDF